MSTGSTDQKIGVLHVITSLSYGGAERVVFDLIKWGDHNNFKFHLVSLVDKNDRLPDFQAIGIEPILAKLRKTNTLKLFSFLITLKKYIKQNNISVIHAHMFHGGLIAQLLRLILPDITVVFTAHSITFTSKWRDKLFKWSSPLRTVDIRFSKNMKAPFLKKKSVIIPNGVEIKKINELKKNSIFTFISIAGLRPVKNHIHLISCANYLLEEGIKDFEIWIIGKGSTETILKKSIKENNLEGHVILKGFKKNVVELASQAHCFVMPSLWEGFPISILEAGLAELPVLATPVGSIPDMLNNNCGYLSTTSNFAEKMKFIILNYQKAIKRGLNLKNKVIQQFDIKEIVKQHEDLYKEYYK